MCVCMIWNRFRTNNLSFDWNTRSRRTRERWKKFPLLENYHFENETIRIYSAISIVGGGSKIIESLSAYHTMSASFTRVTIATSCCFFFWYAMVLVLLLVLLLLLPKKSLFCTSQKALGTFQIVSIFWLILVGYQWIWRTETYKKWTLLQQWQRQQRQRRRWRRDRSAWACQLIGFSTWEINVHFQFTEQSCSAQMELERDSRCVCMKWLLK